LRRVSEQPFHAPDVPHGHAALFSACVNGKENQVIDAP